MYYRKGRHFIMIEVFLNDKKWRNKLLCAYPVQNLNFKQYHNNT